MKTIKHTMTILLVTIMVTNLNAQNWLWARDGGNSVDASSFSVVVNSSGKIYIRGGFAGTFTIDTVNMGTGLGSGYILSANTDGVFLKGTKITPATDIHGQPYSLFMSSLSADLYENIYLTGDRGGPVSFDTAHGLPVTLLNSMQICMV